MKENKTRNLVFSALIAAIYVVLTLLLRPISYGPIQFRVSEALCVLPYFTPAAIPGVFIGCLISNLLGGAVLMDIVFGSLATLIGAIGSWLLRRNRWLVSLPPILSNTLIIPWVLKFAYGSEDLIWYMMITIGIGEILAIGVLGQLLISVLAKYRKMIFG
ncbi:MAG: QueT transporter family protein [Lachnospiraceae bacterium]|nr:QueT transporter family protein [Lachnospiraceae bacterium]MBQ2106095.1 QueT transporter family protein [Lachnospiraceae bacterium]